MLVVEINEEGHVDRDPDYETKRQKDLKKVGYYFIRINDYEEFGRVRAYIAESIKKETEKSTKKLLIDDLSKRLLKLEFKSNHSKKSKCLKWIVKNILPNYKKRKIRNQK